MGWLRYVYLFPAGICTLWRDPIFSNFNRLNIQSIYVSKNANQKRFFHFWIFCSISLFKKDLMSLLENLNSENHLRWVAWRPSLFLKNGEPDSWQLPQWQCFDIQSDPSTLVPQWKMSFSSTYLHCSALHFN